MTPGYKQSEVGVIPVDWDLVELDAVCSMKSGEAITSERIDDSSQYPCYGGNGLRGLTSRFTHDGTFALIGRQGALCGNVTSAQGKFFASEHAVVVTPRTGSDIGFLTYVLSNMHLNRYSESSAQPGLSVSRVKKLPLAIPSTEAEQRAIAAALSDVDALLDALERLIAKKRDIKQAAMQQLLTGQTRLPGFHGEWEVKELGNFIERIVGGGTPSRSNAAFWGDEIPWVTVKDFATFHPSQTQESITRTGLNNSASHLIQAGTLITSTRMALGKAVVYEVDVAINQDLKALYLKSSASVQFLYYWFQNHAQMIGDLGSGSTVKGISIFELRNLPFPQLSLPEQTAIATVLSDMDAEISALEARRDKTRDIKQAMMQALLTGRIRLLQPALTAGKKASIRKRQPRANIHFQRCVLAAEIVDRLHEEPTFGHVKLQKTFFLVENLCDVDTGSTYHRDAAGPYDNRALRSIDKQLRDQEWFDVRYENGRYRYVPMRKRGGHKQYFDRYFSETRTSFDRVISTFRAVNTERCEIVATLFAAWNDLVNENVPVSDEAILNEVMHNWHESKNRIPKDRWRKALDWMRDKGFVPRERAADQSRPVER